MINKKHPKGLYLLFAIEMWERFSYYGMRALLILYLTKSYLEGGLDIPEKNATLLYGFFTGMVYFTPLIGGWLADRYLGQRLSITIGGIIMMLGQFCLAAEQSTSFLYTGLILLVIGNGFFKPNISVVVGNLYPANDNRRDSAFTIFYMGINIGAFFAPLVTGYLAVFYNYRYGFLASGIGMLIGLLIYSIWGNKYLGEISKVPSPRKSKEDIKAQQSLSKEEKDRTWVIIIIVIFCTIFFAGFEQAGSSMSLYTDKFIDRTIRSFIIPTEWFQAVNPLFIIVLAPLFSRLWMELSFKGKNPSVALKMGWGMILLGLGYVVLLGAVIQRGEDIDNPAIKANLLFLIGTYLLHTIGELCLSPIGLSMVSNLAPVKLASLLMGVWLLTSSVANIAGGYLASLVSEVGAFVVFAFIAGISIFFGSVLLCMNKWLVKKSHGAL